MNKVSHSLLTLDPIYINAVGVGNEYKFNLFSNVGVLAASNTGLAYTLNIDDMNLLSLFKILSIIDCSKL